MEIIENLGLSIKQVNIVVYKGSMAIAPRAFFRLNIEIIFCVNDPPVKIIIYNNFAGRLASLNGFNPSLKVIQMRVNYFQISFLNFPQIVILCDFSGSIMVFCVICIVLKTARGEKFTVFIFAQRCHHSIFQGYAGRERQHHYKKAENRYQLFHTITLLKFRFCRGRGDIYQSPPREPRG